MKAFRDPHDSIGALDATTAATIVTAASDLALVLTRDGVIQDIAFQQTDLSMELEGYGRWFGRPWAETVSADSQPKIETLLREAVHNTSSGWRQVTHQTVQGRDVPILYSAIKINGSDRIVAIGRDLRAIAMLQQRLVDAQMSMERDYAKLRFAEMRYRLLFQTASEPVLIVDAGTGKLQEANPAALALFEQGGRRAIGRSFAELFDAKSRPVIQAFLSELRGTNRADDVEATLLGSTRAVLASASVFRQDGGVMLLVRLLMPEAALAAPTTASDDRRLSDFLGAAPDGFLLADSSGRILSANRTFADMAQLADPTQARGAPLDQWLGRPGVDYEVMMANLRQHGSVRLFPTILRGAQGATTEVEASAVALGQGKSTSYGFAIRDVSRRLPTPTRAGGDLPHSAEQLTELIGRVPLKDLVRETTDVIEKLCIEAALELTGDNRASAAEMLGLSRQSLYVKLRRFGFDTGSDETA